MNYEIKEILEYWKFYINEPSNYKLLNVHFDDIKNVLDYITNLQQENQKYKEVIDKATNDLNIIIDIVREQPLGSDCWIIDRLEANKNILKEVE